MNFNDLFLLKRAKNSEKGEWRSFLVNLELINYIPDEVKSSIKAQVSSKIAQCDISLRDIQKDIDRSLKI